MNQSQAKRYMMSTLTSAKLHAPTSKIAALVGRNPVTTYLIMTNSLIWLSLLPVLFPTAHLPQPPGVLSNIAVFALPAFLVTAIADGREGVRGLLGRSLRWRIGIRWYMLSLLGIPVGIFLIAATFLGTAPLEALIDKWPLLFKVFVPQVLIAVASVQLVEEIGWTGFVQHRLQDRHNAFVASLMVAPAFALWHFPTYLIGAPITSEKVLLVLVQIIPLAIFAVFLRTFITWLYNGSGHSILIVALLHAVFNTVSNSELASEFVPESATMWLPLAAVAVLALVVTAFTRGKLAYEPKPGAIG